MHRVDNYYPGIGLSRLVRVEARPRLMEERSPFPRESSSMSRNARLSTGSKGEGGNTVRCSWKQFRSCTGGAVADCVAISCCPCALLDCLYLVFMRIPYLIGKRWCLQFRRRRRNKNKKAKESSGSDRGGFEEQGMTGGRTIEKVDGETETGRVWVEVCEFDHLSFGRVSFTGIPSKLYS